MELLNGNENCAVPLGVLGFGKSGHIQYVHVDGHRTYVHSLQSLRKQAVSRSPHLFIAETLNKVNLTAADDCTSVYFIGKIAIL